MSRLQNALAHKKRSLNSHVDSDVHQRYSAVKDEESGSDDDVAPSAWGAAFSELFSSRTKKIKRRQRKMTVVPEERFRMVQDAGAKLDTVGVLSPLHAAPPAPGGDVQVDMDSPAILDDPDAQVNRSKGLKQGDTSSSAVDMFDAHFGARLSATDVSTIQAQQAAAKGMSLSISGDAPWGPEVVLECVSAQPPASPLDVHEEMQAYGIRPKLQANYLASRCGGSGDKAMFSSRQEAAFFAICSQYTDVAHFALPYPTNCGEVQAEESATLLHVAGHVLNKMAAVKRNNARLEQGASSAEGSTGCQDQGFVRPLVLMLAPTRGLAYSRVLRLVQYLQQERRSDSIQGRRRLDNECGPEGPDDAPSPSGRDVHRPEDFKALFQGTNINDLFCFGIRVTRGTVKLYTDLLESDIIVASPLGLAKQLAEGREGVADFLSCVEVVVAFRADFMLMQNWAHMETVVSHLNRLPEQNHDVDIMRVRQYWLDEQGELYRQSILFSSFACGEMNALCRRLRNYAGRVTLTRHSSHGCLASIAPRVRQLFLKFQAPTIIGAPDARFEHFTTQVWPRLKEQNAAGVLIFVASYFDFVRLRGFLKASRASFAVYSEYTDGANVRRARSRFFHEERRVLLFTERAHFYFRPSLRGVKSIVFYSLPQHSQFYADAVDMLGSEGGDVHATVQALFCPFDFLTLSGIVGIARARKMVKDSTPSFLFT